MQISNNTGHYTGHYTGHSELVKRKEDRPVTDGPIYSLATFFQQCKSNLRQTSSESTPLISREIFVRVEPTPTPTQPETAPTRIVGSTESEEEALSQIGHQQKIALPPNIQNRDQSENAVIPNMREIAELAMDICTNGRFKSVGFFRGLLKVNPQTGKNQHCDLISLSKTEKQIAYENDPESLSDGFRFCYFYSPRDNMERQVEEQKTLIHSCARRIEALCEGSGYHSIYPADEQRLVKKLDYPKKAANGWYGLFLFYGSEEN